VERFLRVEPRCLNCVAGSHLLSPAFRVVWLNKGVQEKVDELPRIQIREELHQAIIVANLHYFKDTFGD
jgi:hypothetical protein